MINTGPAPTGGMRPRFGAARVGVAPNRTGAGLIAAQKPAMRFNPPASGVKPGMPNPVSGPQPPMQMDMPGIQTGPSGPMPVLHAQNGNTGIAGPMGGNIFAPGMERRKPLMPSPTPDITGMTMPNRF